MLNITSNFPPSLIPKLLAWVQGFNLLPSSCITCGTGESYIGEGRNELTYAHFSVSCVECLGQFGKVVVDCVVLQSSAISSKALVQRNGVPLAGEEGREEWE